MDADGTCLDVTSLQLLGCFGCDPENSETDCGEVACGHIAERPGSPTPGQRCSIVNRDAIPAFGAAC
jgi:hypothetical protein